MKVLQLCHKPPLPSKDGGCLAMHTITKGLLEENVELKLITLYTQKHDLEIDSLPESYLEATKIEGVYVDTSISLVDAYAAFITRDSYNVSRFFTPDFDIKLSKLLKRKKFDIVHLESLFMTPYIGTIRRYSKAKIVLRSHNHEHMIWSNVAKGTSSPVKRKYLKHLSKSLKRYEEEIVTHVDGLVSISVEDYKQYQAMGISTPIINIPFGLDLGEYENKPLRKKLSLCHIGAMDWTPNLEGLEWFLKNIWPQVHARLPELQFHLAGRKFPKQFIGNNMPGIVVEGDVEDAKKFISSHNAMVVPLLSAGGIRVKIIEALALGRLVLSTTKGAHGIDYEANRDLLLFENADAFCQSLEKLYEQAESERMARHARALAERDFDNKVLIGQLIEFYKSLGEE